MTASSATKTPATPPAPSAPVVPAPPTFEEVEIPAVTYGTTTVNPFAGKVAELIATWDDDKHRSVKASRVAVLTTTSERVQRQISQAGKALDKSMRQVKTKTPDGASTVITFWAVDKISRPRS